TQKGRKLIYDGITSTYVEKTCYVRSCLHCSQDHLHIRGENPRHILCAE
ncbi:hypothetical protein HMPREF0492_1927, partial [Lactobacillus acidophilus ATCC 4796]